MFPHQIVTIIGIVNPLGQPAFLDTAINVAKDAVLLLQSIRLTAPANVESGGVIVSRPAICGDKIISEGEDCDDGVLGNSATKPNACRPLNCTKAFCGDGVTDSGEHCDAGSSGGPNCTNDCQAICPVLPNVTGINISYGGSGGRVFGMNVTYACNKTGAVLVLKAAAAAAASRCRRVWRRRKSRARTVLCGWGG